MQNNRWNVVARSLIRAMVLCSALGVMLAPAWAGTSVPAKKRVAEQRAKTDKAAKKHSASAVKRPIRVVSKKPRRTSQPRLSAKAAVGTTGHPVVRTSVRRSAPVVVSSPDSFGERLGLREVADPLNLSSSAALVVDQQTQEVLLNKNAKAVLPIASLTKLMTGLLMAEADLPMDEVITITDDDVDRLKNSGSRLRVGTRLTRGEAMHLALMSSENRAAHALARTSPGGVDRFVTLMNHKAAQLGMHDTRYVDPTGLSSENQSSARDLATLVAAAYQKPLLRDLSTSPSYEMSLNGRRVLQYRNSNRLINNSNWDIGLQKTGYIREAGRCLVMQVSLAGRQLIMVLLDAAGPAARVGDAERLRHWVEQTVGRDGDASVTLSAEHGGV